MKPESAPSLALSCISGLISDTTGRLHRGREQDSSLSSGSGSSGDAPCDIGLVERLIRSHPVWFLPGIQRAGAFHLLQSKEEGNFVVRQSSQPNTMAISVRLPAGKGPYIEHYLIQAVDGQLSLESSDNRFDNIPQLIAHYSHDELPVQLSLPRAMREAKNRQQLSSLALLGQEFWRYPMANPRPPERSQVGVEMTTLQQSPPSSGSSLSSLGSGNNNHLNSSSTNTGAQTPTSELGGDAIVLNLTPLYSVEPLQTPSVLTTFKGSDITGLELVTVTVLPDLGTNNTSPTVMSSATIVVTSSSTATNVCTASVSRGPRPTPPNTLNLVCSASSQTATLSAGVRSSNSSPAQQVTSPPSCNGDGSSSRSGPLVVSGGGKTPPPPPPRWAKPTALSSGGQNFTVTTTVTFSVNNTTPPPHVEVSCVQVAPKQSQIEDGHLTTSSRGSTLEQRSMRLHQVVSPSTPTETTKLPANNRVKKHRPNHLRQSSVKESHHYQESDILDSPTVYYRSSVADKFSDYEDIWGPEMLSTFKPTNQIPRSSPFSSPEDISSSSGISKRTPDLLERIGTPVSGSCVSLNSGSNNLKEQKNRLGLWPASTSYHAGGLERIDSTEELPLSSSVDNLALLKNSRNITATQTSGGNKPKGKPVQPPRVRPSHGAGKSFNDTSWAVDSSWEFIVTVLMPTGNEDEGVDGEGGEERERRFPSLEQQETSLEEGEVGDNGQRRVTVQELIAQRFPELLLSPDTVSTVISPNRGPSDIDSSGFSSRMSSYDNVEGRNLHHDSNHHHLNVHNAHPCGSHISDDDTQTIFSEPWDSSRWENLLHMESSESVSNSAAQESSAERLLVPEGNALCDAPSNQSIVSQVKRSKSFKERLDPLLFRMGREDLVEGEMAKWSKASLLYRTGLLVTGKYGFESWSGLLRVVFPKMVSDSPSMQMRGDTLTTEFTAEETCRAIMTTTQNEFATVSIETLDFASKVIMVDHFAKANGIRLVTHRVPSLESSLTHQLRQVHVVFDSKMEDKTFHIDESSHPESRRVTSP
uniref:SH2 domain-containing protein n=1 Tax=Timema genevievae TaxID=629358 RepID=A0A7R9JV07_TIMGE|nr:unnamed protein product [Timema genevievae]